MPPTEQEHLAQLAEQNAVLRRSLELTETKPEAANSVEWLESENEMLQHQANLLAKSKKLLESDDGKLEALFQLQFLNSIPLPVWAADLQAKIVCWAGAAETTYRYKAERALRRNFIELIVAEPEKKQAFSDLISIIYGQEGLGHFNLCKDKDKNGREVYLVTCCFPVYDPRSNEITQAEISFDLGRLDALQRELEEMYYKHRSEQEEEHQRRLALINTITRELFEEVKQYYDRERDSIDRRIATNHDILGKDTSTQAEKKHQSESLADNKRLLIELNKWEADMKNEIARADTTLPTLNEMRVRIRTRTQRNV